MTLLEHAPRFSTKSASQLAKNLYDMRADVTPLPSERDQNFLLVTESNQRFVLKISNALESVELLNAQNALLKHLSTRVSFCQKVIPSTSGEELIRVDASEYSSAKGTAYFVRLVTYLPGLPLAIVSDHSCDLLQDLGAKLAQLDKALTSFDHPAIHRDLHWDLANGLRVITDYSALISDCKIREIINQCAGKIEKQIEPLFPRFRRSIIHGDANNHNIIVDDNANRVIGLIDFGDVVYSFTIAELAVALAYIVLDKERPLDLAAAVTAGYHHMYPLDETEIDALYPLLLLRLCMSVCHAAHQHTEQPANEYLAVSQASITRSLSRLASVDWREAASTLYRACGFATE